MNARSASDARLLGEDDAWIAPTGDPSRPVALTPIARAGLTTACETAARTAGQAADSLNELRPARSGANVVADRLARAQQMDRMARSALYRTPKPGVAR